MLKPLKVGLRPGIASILPKMAKIDNINIFFLFMEGRKSEPGPAFWSGQDDILFNQKAHKKKKQASWTHFMHSEHQIR